MAVFRVQKTEDYTVMSNYHLRDKRLSLKAKGLLSQMLSLPEDWDYTMSGLSHINKESKDAIRSAVNELERAGYVLRHQTTDAAGKFSTNEYIIHERPVPAGPLSGPPMTGKPLSGNPPTGKPSPGKPPQSNIDISNTDRQNTDSSIPYPFSPGLPDRKGCEGDAENYRALIQDNIGYHRFLSDPDAPADPDILNEIVELLTETVCSNRALIRVSGCDVPAQVVRSRLLKLDHEHIRFVLDCLSENTTHVRNPKQYLLAVLFNAPVTMNNAYRLEVQHDMYAGGTP